MVDCGFPSSYIIDSLDKMAMNISFISGVLITHSHSDHVNKAMMKLFNRHNIPVYCHHNVRHDIADRFITRGHGHNHGLLRAFGDEEIKTGSFTFSGFEVPHDSAGGCYGYNIYKTLASGIKKVTISTDMGFPHNGLTDRFIDSSVIVIESNHDIEMLENSGRPDILKQRIREIGHLSNDECADFLAHVLNKSERLPEAIVLAHISQQCNTDKLAFDSVSVMLQRQGYDKIKILLSHKAMANEIVCIE